MYTITANPNDNNMIYGGSSYSYGVYRSTDYGDNWIESDDNFDASADIAVISFFNNTHEIYAAGRNGIFCSSDNGVNWAEDNNGLDIYSVLSMTVDQQSNSAVIHAGTQGGGIYKASVSINSIDESASGVPEDFNLSQNYPNPFNAATIIKYNLQTVSHVKIDVFDILGKKIACLVDKSEIAGNKSVVWDGCNEKGDVAASGIYFYRLTIGDINVTRQMTLIK